MQILLTGGSGFIGRNIIEKLKTKYTICAPSHKECDFTNNEQVSALLSHNSFDVVIHSAVGKGENAFSDTMKMFANLTRSEKYYNRTIVLGSGAEFAKNRNLNKVEENEIGQFIPQDDYGVAKYICNSVIRHQPKMCNLRLFGIYGSYENYLFKFISNTIVKVIFDIEIDIMQDVIFDYLYIDDFIKILDYALENPVNQQDFNVTPTESIKISRIAEIINQVAGKNIPIRVINPNLNYAYTGSNSKLMDYMPGMDFTGYEEGIAHLYAYYQGMQNQLDKEAIVLDTYKKRLNIRS